MGLRFFHDGQFEGRTRKVSVHVDRRPVEPVESSLRDFYARLLSCVTQPEIRDGEWQLLDAAPAWDGNWTWECFVSFAWQQPGSQPLVVVVNYAPNRSQCYLRLPIDEIRGHPVRAQDLMGSVIYERAGDELTSRGLYLDMPRWGFHVFRLETL
jgi:hypothetical protein